MSKEIEEEAKHSWAVRDAGREKFEEECRMSFQGSAAVETRVGNEQSKEMREMIREVEKREGETDGKGGGGLQIFFETRRESRIFTNVFIIDVLLSFCLSYRFFFSSSSVFWRYFVFFRFGLVVFLSLPVHALCHRLLLPDDAQRFSSSSPLSLSPTQMHSIIHPSYSSYSTLSVPLSATILPFSVSGIPSRRIGRQFSVSVERRGWRCWGRCGGGRKRSEEEEEEILSSQEKEEILQLSDRWRISLHCDRMRSSDEVDERRMKSDVCLLQIMRMRGGKGKKKMKRRTSGVSDIQDKAGEIEDTEDDDDNDKISIENDSLSSPSSLSVSLAPSPPTPSTASSDLFLSEDTFVRMFKQHWYRTPPLTKCYLSISAAITISAYFLNHNIWPRSLLLDWALVRRGQIWRLFTSFLYFGNFGLSYLLTTHFLWSYLSNLEKLHYANPEKFFVMILFGMSCLLIAYPSLGISSDMLGHNLSSFLVYVWSRVYEGQEVSVLEMFPLRAECLPWFFVLQTWLVEGQLPLPDLMGICFGWIYFALNREGKLQAPRVLQKIFENPRFRKCYEKYKTEFEG